MATAKEKKTLKAAASELAPQGLTRGERDAAQRARKLRRQTSAEEQQLWHQLRDKQLDGFRFRRQRPIGKYIVDFVCDEAKVIIELDDKLSESNPVENARAAFLKARGYRVISILNSEVATSIKTGLGLIRKHLKADGSINTPTDAAEPKLKSKSKVASKTTKVAKIMSAEIADETSATTKLARKKTAVKKLGAKTTVAKKKAVADSGNAASDPSESDK